jgi:hypothetical protein
VEVVALVVEFPMVIWKISVFVFVVFIVVGGNGVVVIDVFASYVVVIAVLSTLRTCISYRKFRTYRNG